MTANASAFAAFGVNTLAAVGASGSAGVAGVPARLIRYRFAPEVIEALLEWRWWDLPVSELRRLAPDFCTAEGCTVESIKRLRKSLRSH